MEKDKEVKKDNIIKVQLRQGSMWAIEDACDINGQDLSLTILHPSAKINLNELAPKHQECIESGLTSKQIMDVSKDPYLDKEFLKDIGIKGIRQVKDFITIRRHQGKLQALEQVFEAEIKEVAPRKTIINFVRDTLKSVRKTTKRYKKTDLKAIKIIDTMLKKVKLPEK